MLLICFSEVFSCLCSVLVVIIGLCVVICCWQCLVIFFRMCLMVLWLCLGSFSCVWCSCRMFRLMCVLLSMFIEVMLLFFGVVVRCGVSRFSRLSMCVVKCCWFCWLCFLVVLVSVVQFCCISWCVVYLVFIEWNRWVIIIVKLMLMNIVIDELRKIWMLVLQVFCRFSNVVRLIVSGSVNSVFLG